MSVFACVSLRLPGFVECGLMRASAVQSAESYTVLSTLRAELALARRSDREWERNRSSEQSYGQSGCETLRTLKTASNKSSTALVDTPYSVLAVAVRRSPVASLVG